MIFNLSFVAGTQEQGCALIHYDFFFFFYVILECLLGKVHDYGNVSMEVVECFFCLVCPCV